MKGRPKFKATFTVNELWTPALSEDFFKDGWKIESQQSYKNVFFLFLIGNVIHVHCRKPKQRM